MNIINNIVIDISMVTVAPAGIHAKEREGEGLELGVSCAVKEHPAGIFDQRHLVSGFGFSGLAKMRVEWSGVRPGRAQPETAEMRVEPGRALGMFGVWGFHNIETWAFLLRRRICKFSY